MPRADVERVIAQYRLMCQLGYCFLYLGEDAHGTRGNSSFSKIRGKQSTTC